jgi:hypothetical protein
MKQLCSDVWYLNIFFPKCVQKNQVSLKSEKNKGHFNLCKFLTISR